MGSIDLQNVTGMAHRPTAAWWPRRGETFQVPPGPAAILIEINFATGAGSSSVRSVTATPAAAGGSRTSATTSRGESSSATAISAAEVRRGRIPRTLPIDPVTGAGTSVGASGYGGGGNGLAVDPATGTIYATPFDDLSLVRLDASTGAGTEVPGSSGNVPNRIAASTSITSPARSTVHGSTRGARRARMPPTW
ncbi:MAG: hypothetical protein R2862_09965 [Thermoanaerobaculia bacterium]